MGGTCGLLASTARNAYLVAFGIVTFLLEAGRLDKTSFFLILVGFRHFSPMLAGAFIREDMCVFFLWFFALPSLRVASHWLLG